jgi:hypothetical protein
MTSLLIECRTPSNILVNLASRSASNLGRLRRRDVLGRLIHEYDYTA